MSSNVSVGEVRDTKESQAHSSNALKLMTDMDRGKNKLVKLLQL